MNPKILLVLIIMGTCLGQRGKMDGDLVLVYTPTNFWSHYNQFVNTTVDVQSLRQWMVDTRIRTSWQKEYTHVVFKLDSEEFSLTALPNNLRLFCNATSIWCGIDSSHTRIGCYFNENVMAHNNRNVTEQFMFAEQTDFFFPNITSKIP